jgi:UPF0271 protein
MLTIDINCDVGEGLDNESQLMPYISSCNIACGAHAGTKDTIARTTQLALKHHVHIGAHPSFPDRENFGRIIMKMDSLKLQQSLEDQILLVKEIVESHNGKLHHVKPHGALYNLAANDAQVAQAVINAVKNTVAHAFLYVPYGSLLADLSKKNELKTKVEAFADRNYNSDLSLVSRKSENAVLTDKQLVVVHLLKMIKDKQVISIDGVAVKIDAKTFCVHGDNPNAIEVIKYISKELSKNGIKIL